MTSYRDALEFNRYETIEVSKPKRKKRKASKMKKKKTTAKKDKLKCSATKDLKIYLKHVKVLQKALLAAEKDGICMDELFEGLKQLS